MALSSLLPPPSPAPPTPFPQHTRERLFGQLAVISSWFGSLFPFDQAVAWRRKPARERAQLWLGHGWNWVRRTRRRRRGREEADEKEGWGGRGGGVRSWGFRDLWGPLLSWQFELWIRAAGRENVNCLSLLFQVWARVKKKKNPSLSSFQPFVQQPASILSKPLLGGGVQRKMWVLSNTFLVKWVIKSALPWSVLGQYWLFWQGWMFWLHRSLGWTGLLLGLGLAQCLNLAG